MATIHIPTPLRKFTDQNRDMRTDEKTLAGAIEHLVEEYPGIRKNLLDDNGKVRSYIKVYVGDEEVDPVENGSFEIKEETEISIIPAIAGGSGIGMMNYEQGMMNFDC
jgi:sulfur-carrier protein